MHPSLLRKTNPDLQPKPRIPFFIRPTPPKAQQKQRLQLGNLIRLPVRVVDSPSPTMKQDLGAVARLKACFRKSGIWTETYSDEEHCLQEQGRYSFVLVRVVNDFAVEHWEARVEPGKVCLEERLADFL